MKVFKLYNERDTKLVHRAFSQAGLSFTFETNKSKEPHSPHHSIFEVEASLTNVKSLLKSTNALFLGVNF